MRLVLMQKSACDASYSNMHIDILPLCVIIKPVKPTYHHININILMLAIMITHVANLKSNVVIVTWRMKGVGDGRK